MKVLRLCWLGIPTQEYAAMVGFLHDVLGLHVELEEAATTELSLPSGDRVQVFGPEHPSFRRFSRSVALFEVDDLDAAHRELTAAGIEVVGEIERDRTWRWINFRAPDGNFYELAERRQETR